MERWIKLYAKIWSNPVVTKDPDHLAVWLWLLTHASFKDHPAEFNGNKIILKAGQLITGRKSIADETHVSESKVGRILKRFKNEQQIEQQTSGRGSLISIVRWRDYQQSEQQSEQQLNSNWTATEQQLNTKEERIEGYKEKNDLYSFKGKFDDDICDPQARDRLQLMRARIKRVNDEWRTKHE